MGDYYTYDGAAKRIMELKGKQHRTKEQAIEVHKFKRLLVQSLTPCK